MRTGKTLGKARLGAAISAVIMAAGLVTAAASYAKVRAHAAGRTVHVIEHAITDTEIPTRRAART